MAGENGPLWIEFPFFPPAARSLLEDVAYRIARELKEVLLESKTPEDVSSFRAPSGNAQGSLVLRSSLDKGQVSQVLGSWLHCELPRGTTLDMATLNVTLGPETDAPHLLLELIVSGSSGLVLLLDLLPRKDVVMEPEYLSRFYQDTELEAIRQELAGHPAGGQPYVLSSLYLRSMLSATALLFKFEQAPSVADVMRDMIQPAVRRAYAAWVHAYRYRGKEVSDAEERRALAVRDAHITRNGLQADFGANLPRIFGNQVTDRVLAALRRGE